MQPCNRVYQLRAGVAILCAIAMLLTTGCSQSQPATTTKNDSTSKSGHHATLNEIVRIGTVWQMQLQSVKTSQGTSDEQPEGGNVYLICAVRIVNSTSQAQDLYTVTTFTLLDATGRLYTPIPLTFVSAPDGTIAAHAAVSGGIAFEVPASQTRFTLVYSASVGQGYWDVTANSG